MEDVKNLKVKVEIEKIKHCFTTGECGDRTEPGVFYDGNDLAWRNGVVGMAKQFFGQIWGGSDLFSKREGCCLKNILMAFVGGDSCRMCQAVC